MPLRLIKIRIFHLSTWVFFIFKFSYHEIVKWFMIGFSGRWSFNTNPFTSGHKCFPFLLLPICQSAFTRKKNPVILKTFFLSYQIKIYLLNHCKISYRAVHDQLSVIQCCHIHSSTSVNFSPPLMTPVPFLPSFHSPHPAISSLPLWQVLSFFWFVTTFISVVLKDVMWFRNFRIF